MKSYKRTLGAYPISIGTSMAIESITNVGEFKDNSPPAVIMGTEALWVNIRTLIRNAVGAFTSEEFLSLDWSTIKRCAIEDWEGIQTAVSQMAPEVELELYYCNYNNIGYEYNLARFVEATTPKQVHFKSIERAVIAELLKDKVITKEFKIDIKNDKETLIITHMPLDLINYKAFPKLSLLESHTGKVKEVPEWYTKLNVKKEVNTIPFNKAMLVIFGDNIMFRPQTIVARKAIIEISIKRKWTPNTTKAKIIQDIKLAHEPMLLDFIQRYM